MSGFIGGMWYEENTYQEMVAEKTERLENEQIEKDQAIEQIIKQKILKAGVSIQSDQQRYQLNKRPLDNLKVILDKWEKIGL